MRLTQLAVDRLHHHKVAQAEDRLKNYASWNRDHLVFCTTSGAAYAANNLRREYCHPLTPKAGLPYIRPHDFRNIAATLLLLDGVPAIIVSRMLGHMNVGFTPQTYRHVKAEMREMARDATERRADHGQMPPLSKLRYGLVHNIRVSRRFSLAPMITSQSTVANSASATG
jgi:site-specific recombinase XerD